MKHADRIAALVLLTGILAWSATVPSTSPLRLHAAAAAIAQEPDTDGDTMADAWETFFGLDPGDPSDATADPDGDGLTNAQEFAAQRHPVGRHVRYFAEGSTGFFATSVGLLNLSTTDDAHVAIALLNEAGGVVSHRLSLGPRQRQTVSINDVLGVSAAIAIVVESDVPVAADRWMTWGTSGIGASLDSGSPAPATTWYFAEGATGPFLLFYLFENPGETPANVTVRYLLEGRPPLTKTRTLTPHSRTTVFVNTDDPSLLTGSMGSIITSDVPIFAERAMYLLAGGTLGGGAASAGSNQLSTQWYFGEGSTGRFFNAFLAMLNPGTVPATATVTYHLQDGSTVAKAYAIAAESRRTVYFNEEASRDPALAVLATGPVWFTVSSTQPILSERVMWWPEWPWYEGHAAPGSTTSAVSWAIPEGRTGGATREQTYVLVGNTTTAAGQIRLTLIPDSGAPSTRELPIPASQRLTLNIGTIFGLTEARFSVVVDSIGASPVPLAVDYARYRSVNGVVFSGGGAAPAVPVVVGDAAPTVTATTPAANATGVAVDANLTVTFSEPVTAGPGAFVLECPLGTTIPLTTATPSPATTFTLDPTADLPVNTACRLRVVASDIADADATDPPDALAADVTVPFSTSTCAAIAVSPTVVPGGTANAAYGPVTFTQTGGVAPVTWTVTAGAPPAGITLSSAGVLAGTPTASGTSTFTVTVTGTNGCTGSVPLTLSVLAGPNQAPSFTPGTNQVPLEDAGPQSTPWATAISPGPSPDESGQVVTFVVDANTNPGLFSAGPAVSSTGTLTYTPAPNANGIASITLHLQDNGGTAGGGVDSSAQATFTITVGPVNDAPGFTAGANQTVFEDAGAQAVTGWATTITPGPADEAAQTVTFSVTGNTNPALFGVAPAVSPAGDLTYTPAPNAVGTATITLTLQDTGGTANGGLDTSAPQTFTIAVTAVNDAPGFTAGANQSVPQNAAAQTVTPWATAISPGPADEAAQTVAFAVTGNTNPALFSVAPAVSPTGTLTYTPSGVVGAATISLTSSDDGGTANGGVDTSAAQTFTITITQVNDAPSFTAGPDQTVLEDAGPQAVTPWATAISPGPPDEAGQTVTFTVAGNTNPTLFSGSPAVSPTGVLTYTPAANAVGSATITLVLQDNGGTANGGVDTSAPQTFTITVTTVNDAPSFTVGGNQTVFEDSGAQSVPSWAAAISPGPADEGAQTVSFNVTGNTNTALFSVAPAVSPAGTLTYTPAANAAGTATITLTLSDSAGTANGGVDTSAAQTFTITVTGVNDAPSFTAGAGPTSNEDAGAVTVTPWATAISAGPPDEAAQTLTFAVTNNTNPALFSVAPAVSASGTLTYTSAPNAFGTADITIVLQDNGGTANGGVNASAPQTFTITVAPVNDAPLLTTPTITYSTVGNTQLHVQGATLPGVASTSDANGVLTKSGPTDIDGPAAPAAVPLTSFDTGEGTLNLNANGSFTYVPDAGFTGTDTFTIQVTDSVTPVTLTVQITVGELVYYVDNQTGPNNPPGSDGRSTDAWETLAEAEAGTPPNSTIFVFNGNSATTPLAGGIALKNGQKLLGEGVGLTLAPFGTIVPAGTRPRITGAGDIVTVVANTANGDRTGVEIRGLNLSSTGGNAVEATSANTQALGVRISENVVSGTGLAQDGITIAANSTANATVAVHDNVITAGGAGLQIARLAGTVFITAFDDNIVTGTTVGSGVVVTGPNVFFDATPGGAALETVAGGVTAIGAPGDGVGVAGMLLTSVTGDLSFTDLDIVSGNGAALAVTGTGAFTGATGTRITVGPTLGVLTATGGAAAALTNLTADLQLGGLTSTNSVANGILLDTVGGTFTAPATAAITNATNADVSLTGGSATFTYGGTITDDLGTLVSIASTTGGTKSFTGALSDGNDGDGSGISLTNNTGATITFSGGLVLSTGANAAFTATGGGTVNVCDENPCNPATGALANTLTTTSGTALTITGTTIGTSGVTFRSIASNGGTKGIALNTTGSGAFAVTGTGGAGSGGTIQNKSNRGAEFISTGPISLSQMVFDNNGTGTDDINCGNALGATTNGALVTNAACVSNIHLQTVGATTLTSVTATNGDGHGINGYQVAGLTLNGVTIERNGLQVGDDGVQLVNPTGTITVGTSTFRDNAANQFEAQSAAGSATFAITGSFFGLTNFPTAGTGEPPSPDPTTLNSGLLISGSGSANLTVTATGSTFEENYANGYLSDTAGSATMTITLGTAASGNTFTNNGVPVEIVNAATGPLTYTIRNNTITNDTGVTGIFATTAIVADRSGAGSPMTGTIDDNAIGIPGTADSGCFVTGCDAISLPDSATSNANVYHVTVTNNVINHVHGGIGSNIGGVALAAPRTSFVITGNTIQNPAGTTQANGILINSGTIPDNTPQTCVEIAGNTLNGAWSSLNGDSIRYRHRGAAGSSFRVRNYDGTSDIDAFVTGLNTFGAGTIDGFGFQLVAPNVFTGGTAACPQ